jgi:diguanylate cyclase (GGDEF)-like protein
MNLQFVPISIPFIAAFGVGILVVILSLRLRNTPGSRFFSLMMVCIAWWSLMSALEYNSADIAWHITWSKISYPAINAIPILFFFFVFAYLKMDGWLKPGIRAAIWILPFIATVLAATNEWHLLIWPSVTRNSAGIVIFDHGIAYFLMVAYLYSLMLTATALLTRAAIKMEAPYRLQALSVLVAAILPWVANLIYVLGISPAPGVDLASCIFAISGLLLGLGIMRFQMLSLVPVARELVVDIMRDGVLVLDAQDRILDLNPAAYHLLGERTDLLVGESATSILGTLTQSEEMSEIFLEATNHYIELQTSTLRDRNGKPNGRVLVMRNITGRKLAQNKLIITNEQLIKQLEEINLLQSKLREQAIRDPLTGLYNRRFLAETLTHELARAQREEYTLSLAMIDIDDFKSFNDKYGHDAGDEVLKVVSDFLSAACRAGDIVCRYGGDEFILVLPGVNPEIAFQRVKELQESFAKVRIDFNQIHFSSTFTAGIAVYPQHGKNSAELLRAVDIAFYSAKSTGKNTIQIKKNI